MGAFEDVTVDDDWGNELPDDHLRECLGYLESPEPPPPDQRPVRFRSPPVSTVTAAQLQRRRGRILAKRQLFASARPLSRRTARRQPRRRRTTRPTASAAGSSDPEPARVTHACHPRLGASHGGVHV